MSSFGSGSTTTAGASITLRNFTGTDGNQAGTDGLVPGPGIGQAGYVLGAGGDWTLDVLAINDLADATNRIATTAFVQNRVAQIVAGGGGIVLGGIQDVDLAGLADDQLLQYNLADLEWQPVTLTLSLISDVDLAGLQDGNALVYNAAANNGNGGWVPGEGGGGGATTLNELGDVTIAGGADKHFLVRNAQGQYVNRLISTADLSDEADLVLETRGATFGAFDYDFTGANSITVPAPNGVNDATTKAYVDAQVATKQPLDATLTALAGVVTVADKLIYATGADVFATTDLTAFGRILIANANANDARTDLGLGTAAESAVGDFLASNADINDLGGVSTAGKAEGKILKFNAGLDLIVANDEGKTQEEIEDIVGGMVAGNTETGITVTYQGADNTLDFVVDNTVVGFLAGAQNFGGDKTFSGALTATGDTDLTGANFVRVPAPAGATDATTKGYVDTAIAGRQPLEATLTGLAAIAPVDNDIIIATGNDTFGVINTSAGMQTFLGSSLTIQAGAIGDVLRVSAVDGQNIPTAFENTKLASTDLSDTADLILRDGSVAFTGAVSFGDQDITNVGGISLDSISADANTITINLTDNQASALNITEAGNSYLNFVTTDAGEKVVFGKLFEAPTLSKIGDIEISNGQIQTTNGNNNLSFNDNNLSTTGTLGAGATTITSLDVSAGDITNVGDLAVSTISIADNDANAFIIKEGANNYLRFDSTNAAEKVVFEKATAFNQRTDFNNTVVINEDGNGIDFRVETGTQTHALFTDGGTDRVGIFQNNPQVPLDVVGNTKIDGALEITGLANLNGGIEIDNGGNKFTVSDAGAVVSVGGITDTTVASAFATGTTVGDLTLANGSITDANGAISFGDENLSTTGTLGAGATTVTSLSVSDGNITNVADIALDTISADGTTVQVSMTDNVAGAFEIKEAGNSYIKVDTTDAAETITIGSVDLDLTNAVVTATTQLDADDSTRVATTAFVKNVVQAVGNVSDLDDLTDVTLGADNGNGVAEAVGQVLRVSAVANGVATFRNTQLDYDDLSNKPTIPVVGVDAQAQDSTLASISDTGTAANKYIYTTGVDTWAEGDITAGARTFLNTSAGVNDLSDVLIAGVANAQILVYDGDGIGNDNNQWKNVDLSGDITITNAGVATIANNAITTVKINNSAVTNAKLENSYVAITDGANTDNLPLGQTLTFNAVANETTVAVSADQGAGADGVEITIGLPDDVTIAQDLTVTRNLIVNGTTTTLNTATLDVEDTIIRLNKGVAAEANPNDIGLFFERGNTGDDAIFFWDEGDDFFKLGTTDNDDHEATDFGGTTTPGGLQIGSLELRDNLATSLVVKEGANAYLTFDTTDADEKVVFGKVFEAVSASKIGDVEISDGQIQTTNGNNNLSFNDNNLTTTGTANFGATTVDSLDASNGGITQAGAISGITSLAGASMDLLLTDDDADALDIREAGLGSYLTFDTTDAQGQVVVNEGGADIDFRVEGDNSDHLIFTQASTDRVGINTNNPTALFHVNGNSILVGDLTQSGGAVVFNNGLGDNDFRVAGDNQANLLFVDASADSIGIGKNNPSKTLDISGTVAISSTLEVTGKTTLAGSLDLTTGSATGITFRSEIADGGADADQILLRVNQGGAGPAYKSIKWVAADDRFSVESSLKSEGNFTVGADQFIANATNGNLTVGGTATINNAGGTADLIVQNNGVDVLNVDASASTTTVSGQLKTDDLRAKTADGGGDDFKIRIEDNVANALEISDATNGLSFMVFDTRDNAEVINLNQDTSFTLDATFKREISIENTNTNGLFFNSNRAGVASEDATLITIEGGNDKNDVVLAWDTSDNALNLNAEAQVHLQGLAGSNALTIGGALVANATIVMTTAGAITLDGTLDSPTINTNKITNKDDTSLIVELPDTEASALVIREGNAGESYLTINTDAQTITFNEDVNFDASATFDTTVEVTGITTLNDSLKVNKAGSDTGIIFNADRGAGENINAQDFDALLLHVENGGSNATDAYLKWDDSESSFKIEGGKLFSATEISIGSEANNALTKNFTIGTDGAVSTEGAITTSSVVNFTEPSQGAIVFNSDLGDGVAPHVDDDFGLTVNRGSATDAKLYWDEGDDAWKIETGDVHTQNKLVIDSAEVNKIEIEKGSITTANDSGISFGSDDLTTTGSITSASPAGATDDTTVATTEWVRDRSIGDFSDVNLADFDANDQILVWDQVNQEFKKGTSVYNAEQARDDVGAALAGGTHTFTGADGTIAFTNDDANDVINLALGITTENLKDVSADQATNNQVLRFTTAEGANQNKYVPTTLGTAADADTGLDGGEIPTLTTHYLANQSETADLILTGRVIETIDYGAVSEAFDGATDFAIDMNGGVDDFSDSVIYGSEDYGMLVV